MEDGIRRIHEEFVAEREVAMEAAFRRQAKDRRNATLAGGMVGLASTLATAGVTRRAIFWHSFLLEAILGALAGYLLIRLRPDPLGGVLLFSGAFLMAWLIRAMGFDPSVLFASGDLRGVAMVNGNLLSLCISISCGAAMGQILRD